MVVNSIGFICTGNLKDYTIMASTWNCKYKYAVCDEDVIVTLKYVP